MSLTKEVKLEVIEKHGRGPADTGSAEVQLPFSPEGSTT